MAKKEVVNIPRHVGIIMDGNRRWAKKRLLRVSDGHGAGLDRMVGLAEQAKSLGIEYLTVYALSTENLLRPREELDKMFALIRSRFGECVDKILASGAAVRVIGDLSLLPDDVQSLIADGLKKSPERASFTFILALGYGARHEIVRAANRAVAGGREVGEEQFAALLDTRGIPDPDLIIRTGGELRLSNFLLWQAAYAELYFTEVLFPDFSEREFGKAIDDFCRRTRRFGKI